MIFFLFLGMALAAAFLILKARAQRPSKPGGAQTLRRTYKSDTVFRGDSQRLLDAGWQIVGDNSQAGKVAVGRTTAKAIVFLPWAFMRPARKRSSFTVTYVRAATGPPARDGLAA